MHAVNDVNSN